MSELINNFIKNPVEYLALVIAFCVAVFTAYQTYAQRKYNKISVKPFLYLENNYFKHSQDAQFKMFLINGGLGPAVIEEFTALLNGSPCDFAKEMESLRSSFEGAGSSSRIIKGASVSRGERLELVSINFPLKSKHDSDEFQEAIGELDIIIKYSSAYGDKIMFDSRENRKELLAQLKAINASTVQSA